MTDGGDCPVWKPNPWGTFSITHTTYLWLMEKHTKPAYPLLPWTLIWKLPCPPKMQILFWKILLDKIHCNIEFPPFYVPYVTKLTTSLRCFNECKVFQGFRERINWMELHPLKLLVGFKRSQRDKEAIYKISFILHFVWSLWNFRNQAIFQNKPVNQEMFRIIKNAIWLYEHSLWSPKTDSPQNKTTLQLGWLPSELAEYTLNTDGAHSIETNQSGIRSFVQEKGWILCQSIGCKCGISYKQCSRAMGNPRRIKNGSSAKYIIHSYSNWFPCFIFGVCRQACQGATQAWLLRDIQLLASFFWKSGSRLYIESNQGADFFV